MNAPGWIVRDEEEADAAQVFAVQSAAFERSDEARLVEALRGQVAPFLSLVAEARGRIVGHVFFSPVRIDRQGAPPVAGLAPLAVHPQWQRRGIGADLVLGGLARARGLGWKAVFLLGDPDYYRRFGFALAAPRGFHYLSDAFEAGFQVLDLERGAVDGWSGQVHYPAAFAEL